MTTDTTYSTTRNRYLDDTEIKDGIRYTTKEDPNALSNDDFLELMLEQMKQQDPTKPMDSAALMDSQLQMSTIQSNQDMASSMLSLQSSYATSALATAANMIGHVVEDGSMGDDGLVKSFKVTKVENRDGQLYLQTQQLVGLEDGLKNSSDDSIARYDTAGVIYNADNTATAYRISLDANGRFNYNDDGSIKLLDNDGNVVTDETITSKYSYAGSAIVYASEMTTMPIGNVLKVE